MVWVCTSAPVLADPLNRRDDTIDRLAPIAKFGTHSTIWIGLLLATQYAGRLQAADTRILRP
jgi:hypothetical protein